MIKHLIWDLDGTLFDTYPAFAEAFSSFLKELGHVVDPARVIGLAKVGLDHCATILADENHLESLTVKQGFSRHYDQIPHIQHQLMPGARELCEYIVWIGGKNVLVSHRGRQSMAGLLKAHDLESLFPDSISSDDGFPRKPDPTGVQAIITRNGIVPAEALMVGDRALDIEAGRGAGLRTCLLGGLDFHGQVDYQVNNLKELMTILKIENENQPKE
jgi:phosphoglycolate phosphatase-like HAD superfamily hydrolase